MTGQPHPEFSRFLDDQLRDPEVRAAYERARKCPTPNKQAHKTKADAEAHRWAMVRANRGWLLRSYKCKCGAWHVGRRPVRKPRQW